MTAHCDELIVHNYGVCKYCDRDPERQAARIRDGINFTGEDDPNKQPCPATQRRPLDVMNQWHGNIPQPTYNLLLDPDFE